MISEIKNALVEETRPPIYTAMKYWGKKPHNIWRAYISAYVPEGGVVLDPFCGSGMSAFEAVKAGRRAVAFDLNPLSKFVIETLSAPFQPAAFRKAAEAIAREVSEEPVYRQFFATRSRKSDAMTEAHCFKWEGGKIYEVGAVLTEDEPRPKRGRSPYYPVAPDDDDHRRAAEMGGIDIKFWRPAGPFHASPSFPHGFIQAIGGDDFGNLWTRRNLFTLAAVYDRILAVKNESVQRHLLFGFVQSLHLCTKMSVPRRAAAGRPFSTSWGRSAYLCSDRQMEMNPLHLFRKNCLGARQSAASCLRAVPMYLGRSPAVVPVRQGDKKKSKTAGFDIKCGAVDVNALSDYLAEASVDFVITDPPYGGLVQYLDLSELWLRWLARWDAECKPNFGAEITVKPGVFSAEVYQRRFVGAMRQIHRAMKADATAVFTFHNREISVWNAFLKAVHEAGFEIARVVHQYNRRSGEAAVSHPYGTSASDFYVQCRKGRPRPTSPSAGEFEDFVAAAAVRVIAERNERTPYEFVESGVLVEISQAGFDLGEFNRNIPDILRARIGDLFEVGENKDSRAGDLWWLVAPEKHISRPDLPLRRRVETVIVRLLRRKTSVTLDDVLGAIFPQFVNGLTPDIRALGPILQKYASKSGGRWIVRNFEIDRDIGAHTGALKTLAEIGRALGFMIFIGKREQWEGVGQGRLSDCADFVKLPALEGVDDERRRARAEMIDMLWLSREGGRFRVARAIEVENTTDFISAIQRASNLPQDAPKLMVVPDGREAELRGAADPAFLDGFRKYRWRYLTYGRMNKLRSARRKTEHDVFAASREI